MRYRKQGGCWPEWFPAAEVQQSCLCCLGWCRKTARISGYKGKKTNEKKTQLFTTTIPLQVEHLTFREHAACYEELHLCCCWTALKTTQIGYFHWDTACGKYTSTVCRCYLYGTCRQSFQHSTRVRMISRLWRKTALLELKLCLIRNSNSRLASTSSLGLPWDKKYCY